MFDVVQGLWNSVHHAASVHERRASASTTSTSRRSSTARAQSLTDLSTGIVLNNETSQQLALRTAARGERHAQLLHRSGARRPPRVQVRLRRGARAGADRDRPLGRRGADLPQPGRPARRRPARPTCTLYNTPVISRSADRHLLAVRAGLLHRQQADGHGGRAHRAAQVVPAGAVEPGDRSGRRPASAASRALPRSFGASGNIINWWNTGPRVERGRTISPATARRRCGRRRRATTTC